MHRVDQQRQVTGLSFEQARFVVALIPADEIQNWLAWHEGLEKWQPLASFEIFQQADSGPRMTAPPFPPNSEVEVSRDDLVSTRPSIDKRLTRRFLKEFDVQVTGSDGKTYSSATVNLSTSGMLLRDRLPSSVGKSFSCVIAREDGSQIKIFCALVKDGGPKSSGQGSRIKFLDVSQPKILLNWLIDSKTR